MGTCCPSRGARTWPDRLNVLQLERKRKRLLAMAQSDGVGEKSEQLMMRKSTSLGWILVLLKSDSRAPHTIVSASCRAQANDSSWESAGSKQRTMPGGQAVLSPVPELLRTFSMNARSSSLKEHLAWPMRRTSDMSSS
eukprot:scaffold156109_cov35-Tisochrysis_lutea.AAC.3